MMSYRGDMPAQATALAVLLEIADLLRNAEKTVPAGIADLREAAAEAKAAQDALNDAVVQHAQRVTDIELREKQLQQAFTAVQEHEAECQDREAATAAKQDRLDELSASMVARKLELDRQQGLLSGDQAEFNAGKLLHASELKTKTAAAADQVVQLRQASEVSIQATRDKAAADIRAMRANAQAEITAAQEEIRTRLNKIVTREDELHRERARISALLQE